ncbi:uncharacterized protein PGTG_11486 [Puccinia graminis f. sp. tritici CRL 75-36-700-3]|uniref:protein-tyrosine-phosphatase n=1 Tax=Puccinia graminis f. sp. tritici (strain CRL 75-36-700-3 / race SCCL) TaxID=418459 RepID=E3KLW8_PUCGT|nr:uncharacterized protein PGTG_11486 [Puccinia graminis f. sp. tritici CRL 75-36-700-3]EFP85317.2 hypothetical protein PGTG_11486 [Puccinia graminis f. sp. tritici CRL 75-36-700-3]
MATTTALPPPLSPATVTTSTGDDRISGEERMQQVVPRLFIGDLTAAQSLQVLQDSQIRNVVSVIKHSCPQHPGFNHLNVPLDDTERTNICEWFDSVASWIQARLDDPNGYGVLIHCVAGVSRSTTLLAAYLMKAYRLTTDEAVGFIASKRPQVQPNDFFFHQLEMYERCECEWNPVKHQEQRRFLMSFVADEMKDGAGAPKLILAYYPSPAPSPAENSSLTMTAMKTSSVETKLNTPSLLTGASINSQPLSLAQPPARRRLTKKTDSSLSNGGGKTKEGLSEKPAREVEKLGQGQVVIHGRRLRCKMCRRELAGRDHILFHSPGKGQQAFAPQKQDMAQFRLDQVSPDRKPKPSDPAGTRPVVGLASLRIAVPPKPIPKSEPVVGSTEAEHSTPASSSPPSTTTSDSSSPVAPHLNLHSPPLSTSVDCSSYFVEPLSWMGNALQAGNLHGKLVCPNSHCLAKLGSFDWAGSQCSCGAWITPGFQILRSKVDEI